MQAIALNMSRKRYKDKLLCKNALLCECLIISYGEFDPGSGRTLAACLRNASRAKSRVLAPEDLAANGRVTRKQPALKTGIAHRKVD